jgi:uncharacterized protein GlcG (DUF336 family)
MSHQPKLLLLAALLPVVLQAQPPAQLLNKKALTLEVAKKVAAAGEEFARKNTWKVAIAILDDGANLLYFQRMDGVQIGSIEVSLRKAESAVKFKRPSKAFADGVASRPQLVNLPGAFPFEGGVPLVYQGEVIGAIGVSGATAEQDEMVARAGADALVKILGQ